MLFSTAIYLFNFKLKQEISRCPANQGTYPIFYGIWNLIIFSLGPSIAMLIFGFLTIQHVRQSMRRVIHSEITNQLQIESPPLQEQLRRQKKIDRQLIRMMLVQCLYFTVLSTPVSVSLIQQAVKVNVVQDTLQNAKDSLFRNITGALSFVSACTTFYVFTLSSQLFRQELMRLFKRR